MLSTYIENPEKKINYILYTYFPNTEFKEIQISQDDISKIIKTENSEYISKYICKIFPISREGIKNLTKQDKNKEEALELKLSELQQIATKDKKTEKDKRKLQEYYSKNSVEADSRILEFIENHFIIKFAESYEDLEIKVKKKLVNETKLNESDIDNIFYPNAIHKIACLSTNSNNEDRKINKKDFLKNLNQIKKVTLSKWTKELKNFKQLIKEKQQQLSINLDQNNRKRFFLINIENLTDFNNEIVTFIADYVKIYCCKPNLHQPALFCLKNANIEMINEILSRLHEKSIDVETGYRGNKFFPETFFKEPKKILNDNWIQFKIRLCCENDEIYSLINNNKPDDFFIIDKNFDNIIKLQDINIELLDIETFDELKFLLKMRRGGI